MRPGSVGETLGVDEEYYWAADKAIQSLQAVGWTVEYEQVSVCAGVYTIRPG